MIKLNKRMPNLAPLIRLILWPSRVAYRDVGRAIVTAMLWPFRQTWRGICAVGRFIRRITMAVLHSPVGAYRAIIRGRDWLLAKIEYLQAESKRWSTVFRIAKSPYSFLRMMGLSPQMATGLLVAGSTVGGGAIVNETLLSERSFSRGDSGVYSAPSDIPTSYSDANNTLRIDLHGSTPVGEITISDVTLGTAFTGSTLPSGESSVILIGGTATSSNFIETWLEVGHLIIDRWRCTNFEMSDVETHTLIIVGNSSDGQSLSPIPGTPRRRAIGGGNRADSMRTNGGTYDQLVLGAPTSGINGKVDKLTLSNLYTKGGLCKVSRIKADKIEVLLSEFGAGNGFATKEFIVKNSVIYKQAVIEDNVEVTIAPP
jgi:hypothetical protein